MADKTPNTDRFTEHAHVTAEEAGAVKGKNGEDLFPGDDGFMEALSRELGFSYKDLS